MTKAEALISESVTIALQELGLADKFDIARVSVAEDGALCAQLESKDQNYKSISVCIEDDESSSVGNVDLFKDRISRFLFVEDMEP